MEAAHLFGRQPPARASTGEPGGQEVSKCLGCSCLAIAGLRARGTTVDSPAGRVRSRPGGARGREVETAACGCDPAGGSAAAPIVYRARRRELKADRASPIEWWLASIRLEHQRIFECHGRTLGHVGRCRVRRIADQHNTTLTPGMDCHLLDGREMDRIEALELTQNVGHWFGEVARIALEVGLDRVRWGPLLRVP